METSEFLATVSAMHAEGRSRGLFFQHAGDEPISGRVLTVGGRHVVNWASCSYLGLELHPALIDGVHRAVDRYGTQFSSSRGYISSPQYEELESLLSELFGGRALVTPTTTLGHQATLGSVVTERDAILYDHQVHASVQIAATLARGSGAHVELVRHGDLDRAVEIVRRLARTRRTVWILADGVYSMYGDLAPIKLLNELLDAAPNVRLYVDDAHGMSWAGKHGRGSFLSRMPLSERVVLATSFAKGFGSGGACVVFDDPAESDRVRMCGGPMLFSGPLQPPTLGALIASARIHLSPEILTLQEQLRARVDAMNEGIVLAGLPMLAVNESPIFFIRIGTPSVAMAVAERMMEDGHLVNVSMYPSVPLKRAGLRLAVTASHSPEQVADVISCLVRNVNRTFAALGVAREEVDALFDGAAPSESLISDRYRHLPVTQVVGLSALQHVESWVRLGLECDPATLIVEHHTTITEVDRALWDERLGGRGQCSWDAQVAAESTFQNQALPEHNWQFHYYLLRSPNGAILLLTFFAVALHKDDMLMRAEVSEVIEQRRRTEPYFLTSKAVIMGGAMSEGDHLWIDRDGPWRAALYRLLREADALVTDEGATTLMIRDLPANDPELDAFMLERGLVKMPTLPTHHVDITWRDDAGMKLASSRRLREHLTDIFSRDDRLEVRVFEGGSGELPPEVDTQYLMQLYRNVADRKFRLNMFKMPDDLASSLLRSPAWEVAVLWLKQDGPADGRPVACYFAHRNGRDYAPLMVGLDYHYVYSEKTYRYLLVHVLRRAAALGYQIAHMGMDAEVEKIRLGARVQETCAYVRSSDHYNAAVLHEIVAEVGLRPRQRG
jgi:7-keto-8-aminopelargonate synthetase-like enzyme